MPADKPRVLFVCTGNSCRSQMAEALLRRRTGDRIEACSAGLTPAPLHPLTVQVLEEIGIDTAPLRSKGIHEFLGKMTIDYAVVVCENAQQACPKFYPFALHNIYWPFEDPAAFVGSPEETLRKFRSIRDQIARRIDQWLEEEII